MFSGWKIVKVLCQNLMKVPIKSFDSEPFLKNFWFPGTRRKDPSFCYLKYTDFFFWILQLHWLQHCVSLVSAKKSIRKEFKDWLANILFLSMNHRLNKRLRSILYCTHLNSVHTLARTWVINLTCRCWNILSKSSTGSLSSVTSTSTPPPIFLSEMIKYEIINKNTDMLNFNKYTESRLVLK